MTPSAQTRPSPGAWPLRPCFPHRTLSRVRKPGPSPLLSSTQTSRPVRGRACSGPASACAAHRRVLIGRSSQSRPAFPTRPARLVLLVVPPPGLRTLPVSQDSRLAGGHRADPGGEAPAGTHDVARLAQGTLGRDAGTHPGPGAARGDRGQSRPRSPLGEAVRILPHGACIPRTYVPGSGAPLGHSRPSLPRRRVGGACHRPGDILPLSPGSRWRGSRGSRGTGQARLSRAVLGDLPPLGIWRIRRS